ncbi:hypothetical protein CFOLD11_12050 [Clostridium folliculivorans]|uniref:T4 beta protein n=1 Tax=Clostridium folliculivorans TaxID=2886038 RepID=A0A9W5Y0P3_9CLOT|nr:beta family protein [Clostridium folliculivorans]GKU24379.1 hypothetical protein CFOLD11_12050 [Clostridium folliculivorans]
MTFKYVPILRNLTAEREALKYQKTSAKIMPLIELVSDKPRENSKLDFKTFSKQLFNDISTPFFVDIPMYIKLSKRTKSSVTEFLDPIYQNQIKRCNYLNLLSNICPGRLVPVISYNPNIPYTKKLIVDQVKLLRANYKKLAFRIFAPYNNSIIDELKTVLKPQDIILLDIFQQKHNSTSLLRIYPEINTLKNTFGCTTVILHSALPDKLPNTKLQDNKIIQDASTNLITSYNSQKYKFDAFGDFAGIKVSNLENIPVSSPAYIHYCALSNNYIGFKGLYRKVRSFETMVLPKYTFSSYWSSIPKKHKNSCYGCTLIERMLSGKVKINYAPRWKTLTICHYIKSMDEVL